MRHENTRDRLLAGPTVGPASRFSSPRYAPSSYYETAPLEEDSRPSGGRLGGGNRMPATERWPEPLECLSDHLPLGLIE